MGIDMGAPFSNLLLLTGFPPSIDPLTGLQVAKPTLNGGVVESQNCQVAQPPVSGKGLLWATGQAAITPNAPIAQERVRL
jgi:hypothetical protein